MTDGQLEFTLDSSCRLQLLKRGLELNSERLGYVLRNWQSKDLSSQRTDPVDSWSYLGDLSSTTAIENSPYTSIGR